MKQAATDRGRRRFLDWFLTTSVGGLLVSTLYPVVRFINSSRTAGSFIPYLATIASKLHYPS